MSSFTKINEQIFLLNYNKPFTVLLIQYKMKTLFGGKSISMNLEFLSRVPNTETYSLKTARVWRKLYLLPVGFVSIQGAFD